MELAELRAILTGSPGSAVELPAAALGLDGLDEAAAAVFPDGVIRIEDPVIADGGLVVEGQSPTLLGATCVPVRARFAGNAVATGALIEVEPGPRGPGLLIAAGEQLDAEVPPGAWLALPASNGRALVPLRTPVTAQADPARRDGLGRARPARTTRPAAASGKLRRREPYAIPVADGFVIVAAGASRRPGGLVLTRHGPTLLAAPPVTPRWDISPPSGGSGVSVDYENWPLRISGALTALPQQPPYKTVIGGVLVVDTGALNGSIMAAYVVPESGTMPSFFAYGSLGKHLGIGPPPFMVRGISLGFGWNSRVRMPPVEQVETFPFIEALDGGGQIGDETDPLAVLAALIGGGTPWISPAEDSWWIAAGLAFTCFETIAGRAMAIVQGGSDLTIALLGTGRAELPRASAKKWAQAEIALEVVFKPVAGEFMLGAALTRNSFLVDPDCKLHGGVSLKIWFGSSEHAGDFVLSIGGYHPGYTRPVNYPAGTPVGITWGLGNTVTISGSAYAAFTPAAVMAGGIIDLRFHSGALKAWLTARANALVQWKPFYFDLDIGVRVGVSASVKLIFVRVTITIEVGVDLRLWGPPVGGEATVHLWFISFTIGFGTDRVGEPAALDWTEFQELLPPSENTVRVTATSGLLPGPGAPASRRPSADWQASAAGFVFTTETVVPASKLYVDGVLVGSGPDLVIRPMRLAELTSEHWVSLTRDGDRLDLERWQKRPVLGSVPQALWGSGDGQTLPEPGDQLLERQIIGAELSSPALRNGNSTGYITEQTFAFDPLYPLGLMPLEDGEPPGGPVPARPPDAVGTIAATVDSPAARTARGELADALRDLGTDLGELDDSLPRYALAAQTAFTAVPMLVPPDARRGGAA